MADCLFSAQREGRNAIAWPGLRQVIAERGEHHVVDGLRCETGGTAPATLCNVRVLESPADAPFRTLVNFVPEAHCAFGDEADVARAGATAGWSELVRWWIFRTATAVIGERVAVSADLVEAES